MKYKENYYIFCNLTQPLQISMWGINIISYPPLIFTNQRISLCFVNSD